jgi:hypothetical protein
VHLRLTRQALEDLGLPIEAHCRKSADEYKDEHAVVRAFVALRSESANGAEITALPSTSAVVYNLHAGRYRGLTWHDEESDVVWLLGAGKHESGSIDDAYEVLKRRDSGGTLMPVYADYDDLETSMEEKLTFLRQVQEQVPDLLSRAVSAGGSEVEGVIAGRLAVSIVAIQVEDGEDACAEVSLRFRLPPLDGPCRLPPHPSWLIAILAAMFPHANVDEFEYGRPYLGSSPTKSSDIVVSWCGQSTP